MKYVIIAVVNLLLSIIIFLYSALYSVFYFAEFFSNKPLTIIDAVPSIPFLLLSVINIILTVRLLSVYSKNKKISDKGKLNKYFFLNILSLITSILMSVHIVYFFIQWLQVSG